MNMVLAVRDGITEEIRSHRGSAAKRVGDADLTNCPRRVIEQKLACATLGERPQTAMMCVESTRGAEVEVKQYL